MFLLTNVVSTYYFGYQILHIGRSLSNTRLVYALLLAPMVLAVQNGYLVLVSEGHALVL